MNRVINIVILAQALVVIITIAWLAVTSDFSYSINVHMSTQDKIPLANALPIEALGRKTN